MSAQRIENVEGAFRSWEIGRETPLAQKFSAITLGTCVMSAEIVFHSLHLLAVKIFWTCFRPMAPMSSYMEEKLFVYELHSDQEWRSVLATLFTIRHNFNLVFLPSALKSEVKGADQRDWFKAHRNQVVLLGFLISGAILAYGAYQLIFREDTLEQCLAKYSEPVFLADAKKIFQCAEYLPEQKTLDPENCKWLKKTFHQFSLAVHPDKNAQAAMASTNVNSAYQLIKNFQCNSDVQQKREIATCVSNLRQPFRFFGLNRRQLNWADEVLQCAGEKAYCGDYYSKLIQLENEIASFNSSLKYYLDSARRSFRESCETPNLYFSKPEGHPFWSFPFPSVDGCEYFQTADPIRIGRDFFVRSPEKLQLIMERIDKLKVYFCLPEQSWSTKVAHCKFSDPIEKIRCANLLAPNLLDFLGDTYRSIHRGL